MADKKLGLYKVEVEYEVYVLAMDEAGARLAATAASQDITPSDYAFATEVSHSVNIRNIDSDWWDSAPYVSRFVDKETLAIAFGGKDVSVGDIVQQMKDTFAANLAASNIGGNNE